MKTLRYPGDARECVGQYVGPTQLSAMEWLRIDTVNYDPETDTSTATLKFVGVQEVVRAKWAHQAGEADHPGYAVHLMDQAARRRP